MQRAPGFYWVILDGRPGWMIAEWTGDTWLTTGGCGLFEDEDFDMIDERPQFYDHRMDQEPPARKNHHRLKKVLHKDLKKRK